jgi:hypothetical protein
MIREAVSDRKIVELEEILEKVRSFNNWSLVTGH